MTRASATPRTETIDRWSVRLYHGRDVWRVYDVRVEGPAKRVSRAPIGAAAADARVFVPPPTLNQGRLMYVLHRSASHALDAETLAFQLGAAGWMQWMLYPVGALGPRDQKHTSAPG